MPEYHATGYRLDGPSRWLLWFTETQDSAVPEPDGVVTEQGRVLAFATRADAERFGLRRGWAVKPPWQGREPPLLRLDRVARWVQQPRKTIDAALLLDSWNLLLDVARSVGAQDNLVVAWYSLRAENDLYEKLFLGNNLPGIRRDGPLYRPVWSGGEVVALRDLFQDGLALFRRVLHPVGDTSVPEP